MTFRVLTMLASLVCLDAAESFAQFIQEWARIYPSAPNEFAEAVDVQMDADGNVYTLGLVANDMLLIKYNPAGDTLWTRRVVNSGRPLKFELDQTGYPVVAVAASLRKYTADGNLLWTRNVAGSMYTMSLDSLDNVLAGTASLSDVTAFKYSSSGDSLWRRAYPASGFPTASATDVAGNFYLSNVEFFQGQNFLVIKYTPAGDTAWVRRYDRMGFTDYPNDIEVDNQGNVVLAGYSSTSFQPSGKDYCILKYSPAGELLWQRHFDGPGGGEDQANSVSVDEQGNIFTTGGMTTSSGSTMSTVELSSQGDSLWAHHDGGTLGSRSLVAKGLDLTLNRHFELVAFFGGILDGVRTYYRERNGSMHSVSYTPPGDEKIPAPRLAANRHPATSNSRRGEMLEFAIAAHVVSFVPLPASRIHTVKFSAVITDVLDQAEMPTLLALHQNYPNPFNPSTNIRFEVGGLGLVSLKVYDVLGREVATLVNEAKAPGSYEVTWDAEGLASGLYLYRLQAGSYSETRKLVLLR